MTEPRISVVIPTFNRAHCVGEAVASVLAQTRPPHELIVVDDGSTDNTAGALAQFGQAVTLIRQPNQGVSVARNTGIEHATGEWIALLDSDDICHPGRLEEHALTVKRHPNAVAHMVDALVEGYGESPVSMFSLRGCKEEFAQRPLRPDPLLDVLRVQFFTSTWLLKRSAILEAGPFRPGMTIYEDLEVLSRMALKGPFAVSVYGGVGMRRIAGGAEALSHQHANATPRALGNLCLIYEQLARLTSGDPGKHREVRHRLSATRLDLAKTSAREGDWRLAARLRWQSVRDRPGLKSALRAGLSQIGADGAWRTMRQFLKPQAGEFRRSQLDRESTSSSAKQPSKP